MRSACCVFSVLDFWNESSGVFGTWGVPPSFAKSYADKTHGGDLNRQTRLARARFHTYHSGTI